MDRLILKVRLALSPLGHPCVPELTKSIEFESKKREDLEEKCKNLENNLKSTMEALKTSEEKRVVEESKLDELEQYTRKYNLEIIMLFSTYQAKQRLYMAMKLTFNVDWSAVFGYQTAVYINENLIKKRKNLFMETRRAVKLNHWFGCWTVDGKSF
ncbi:hypothetical protein AC249_AIPGENE9451 [Exaiptasia diaphana]|nr:hypothetical protein AC249_AIPGENE9451 [Exaiptasia diaphana]